MYLQIDVTRQKIYLKDFPDGLITNRPDKLTKIKLSSRNRNMQAAGNQYLHQNKVKIIIDSEKLYPLL
jgi:hypothetical protein